MSAPEILTWIAGGRQLVVGGYALRLNRLFGTAKAGWPLFCSFALLASSIWSKLNSATGHKSAPKFSTE